MSGTRRLPVWLDAKCIIAASVAGVVLFAASYAGDAILYMLKIPSALTIADNFAIAIVGVAVVLAFLYYRHEQEVMARAKERAIIIAEMNHHIRNAMTPLIVGLSSDDLDERMRTLDQATDRVDHVLTDLLPTAGSATKPRYF